MTQSLEDYLEAISHLVEKEKVTRVKDIAESMKVSRPSVHIALHELADRGLVIHEHYGYIELTGKGEETAAEIIRKHNTYKEFLIEVLDVSPEVAEKDACSMEHFLSPETEKKIKNYVKKTKKLKAESVRT
jgi:DtxR family Mn-dependent transcriptional regulator